MEQRAVRAAPHRRRQPERPGEAERPRRRHRQRGAEHAAEAVLQQVAGALALGAVGGIRQVVAPAANREALHGDALPLERQDLASDEAVADLRILVDEIGDAQAASCGYLHGAASFVFDQHGLLPAAMHQPRLQPGQAPPGTCRHEEQGARPAAALQRRASARPSRSDLQRIDQRTPRAATGPDDRRRRRRWRAAARRPRTRRCAHSRTQCRSGGAPCRRTPSAKAKPARRCAATIGRSASSPRRAASSRRRAARSSSPRRAGARRARAPRRRSGRSRSPPRCSKAHRRASSRRHRRLWPRRPACSIPGRTSRL